MLMVYFSVKKKYGKHEKKTKMGQLIKPGKKKAWSIAGRHFYVTKNQNHYRPKNGPDLVS